MADITKAMPEITAELSKETPEITAEINGVRGPKGFSAYELAVQEGFEGTLAEWLLSLIGPRGYSPSAKVTTEGNTTTITLTDLDGTTSEDIVTPTAKVERLVDGARITITDKDGTTTAVANDGHSPVITTEKVDRTTTIMSDGRPIGSVYSPIARVNKTGNITTISVKDEDGVSEATVTSPEARVEKSGRTATITITDDAGTTTAEVTDGYSPAARVTKENGVATITVTDESGTTTAQVADGFVPSAKVEKDCGTTTITITDAKGTTEAEVYDAFNPSAKVEKTGDTATVTLTDIDGTTTAQIQDGHSPTLTTERDGADMIIKSDGSSIGSFTVPRAAATKTGDTATITITDETGEHSAQIQDGHSPVISTTKSGNVITMKSDDTAVGTITIPTANVRKQNGVATITVTDQDGATEAAVSDGYSPAASVQTIPGGARITVEDSDGTTSADVMVPVITTSKTGGTTTIQSDGQPIGTVLDGAKGDPGVSPTVATSVISGGHRVTVTDAEGSRSFDVMDGDATDAPVQDVQVNGVSVLSDGVANVPTADANTFGVIKAHYTGSQAGWGIGISNGELFVAEAATAHIKGGSISYRPIVPARQHEATFYGLAKAAGSDEKNSTLPVGQYTEEAKAAIQNMIIPEAPSEETAIALLKEEAAQTSMFQSTLETIGGLFDGMPQDEALQEVVEELQRKTLLLEELYGVVQEGGVVHVDGSDPVIVAQPNRRYVCGEVASLTFTPCESGISDVVFSCGGTKTLLTLPQTVKMPEDFDVELNTTYEINIMDGVYAGVMSWT